MPQMEGKSLSIPAHATLELWKSFIEIRWRTIHKYTEPWKNVSLIKEWQLRYWALNKMSNLVKD